MFCVLVSSGHRVAAYVIIFSKTLKSSFIRKLSFGFVVSSLLIAAIAFLCEYFGYFGWFDTLTGSILQPRKHVCFVVRFREWSLRTPVRNRKVSAEVSKEAELEITTGTRWGKKSLTFPSQFLELFYLMDGKRSRRRVYDLFKKRGYKESIGRFLRLLGQLRRSGCIDLNTAKLRI